MRSGRPEKPEDGVIPFAGTAWFRLEYELAEGMLVAKEKAKLDWYAPIDVDIPLKQPKGGDGWLDLPHVSLARLGEGRITDGDVLEFADRWGLLGLWKMPGRFYKGFGPRPTEAAYRNPRFVRREAPYHLHVWQEPLAEFREAAAWFSRLCRLLEGSPDEKSAAQDLLNPFLAACSPVTWYLGEGDGLGWRSFWQTPSLLHACCLLRWFDLSSGRLWRWCAHSRCRKAFLALRPDQLYCSNVCGDNGRRLRSYYIKKSKMDGGPEGRG